MRPLRQTTIHITRTRVRKYSIGKCSDRFHPGAISILFLWGKDSEV